MTGHPDPIYITQTQTYYKHTSNTQTLNHMSKIHKTQTAKILITHYQLLNMQCAEIPLQITTPAPICARTHKCIHTRKQPLHTRRHTYTHSANTTSI